MNRKTVGLSRVSSHQQDDLHGGSGLQFQQEKILQYCELNDYNLYKIISDVCSGSFETREGVDEIKQMVLDGEVERVVIWNTSRCFRSMLGFSLFYKFLKNHDVELVSVSEGISSLSKHGSMIFGLMISISVYEKEIITERMMSGKITKFKNGERKFGGRMVYGYENQNGEIVVNQKQSEVVQFIFNKMNKLMKQNLTKTKRTQKLLKSLRRKGYSFKGKDFTHQNVKSVLNNKFYVGEMSYGNITSNHNYETIVSKRLFNNIHQ